MRQGLKVYSDWPTYPQLYASGNLIGGLDVVKELIETGELEKELKSQGAKRTDDPTSPSKAKDATITTSLLKEKITHSLHAEIVEVTDLSDGCGLKFSILVVSPVFEGQGNNFLLDQSFFVCVDSLVAVSAAVIERQRSVHKALEAEMPQIHALTLKCLTPSQHR